ncbi:MAG: hypothetical protein ACE5HI_07200 [bacterium]
MKRLFIISGVLVFWFGLFSCKDVNEPVYESYGTSFPLSIGSWWQYGIVDTLIYTYTGVIEIHYDTVRATIEDSTTLPNGKSATVWIYEFKDRTDTLYASLSDDTLLFYRWDGKILTVRSGFILPLQIDQQWQLSILDYEVESMEDIEVPAGKFKNVFLVREHERQGNAFGWNSYYIAPDFGIIKYKYGTFVTLSEINHKIEWKLLSFYVPQ